MNSLLSYYLESARLAILIGNKELARYELGSAMSITKRIGDHKRTGRILSAFAALKRI